MAEIQELREDIAGLKELVGRIDTKLDSHKEYIDRHQAQINNITDRIQKISVTIAEGKGKYIGIVAGASFIVSLATLITLLIKFGGL